MGVKGLVKQIKMEIKFTYKLHFTQEKYTTAAWKYQHSKLYCFPFCTFHQQRMSSSFMALKAHANIVKSMTLMTHSSEAKKFQIYMFFGFPTWQKLIVKT
jgi:hypothetical protein